MATFWIIIFFLFIGFAIWAKSQFPKWHGIESERFIRRKLENLDPTHYKTLNDVMLPSQGHTKNTQIDHVVVSNFGIFCIETKAYKGWIFGNAKSEKWTQVIYRYRHHFYNPLRQNYAHTQAIRNLVRTARPIPMLSLVAFPYTSKLEISGTDMVGNGRYTLEKIQSFKTPVLSNEARDKICEIIQSANIVDKELRKLHNIETRELKY